MKEGFRGVDPTTHDIDSTTYEQYREFTPYNLRDRRDLILKFSPLPNSYQLIAQKAEINQLREDHKWLEAGYGDGYFINPILAQNHCRAEVTAINNVKKKVTPFSRKLVNAKFQTMDVRSLDFPDNYFDRVTCNNVLYHVDNYQIALAELARVLKSDGIAIIATRGPDHLKRLWELQEPIINELKLATQEGRTKEDYSQVVPPPNFYRPFLFQNVRQDIEAHFEIVDSHYQSGEIPILFYGWRYYKRTLGSLGDSYRPIRPTVRDLSNAIDIAAKPVFEAEIVERGYFAEYEEQGFYVCRKRPSNP